MATSGVLTLADIIPLEEYARARSDWKRKIGELKRHRRVAVGPYVTFYFESRDTMWLQVQEMLYIEKGGEAQARDELKAYNPLIPNGSELSATFTVDIDDAVRRETVPDRMCGIEEAAFLRVAGETIKGVPEADQDRATAEDRASSVRFVHFPFTPAQVAVFRSGEGEVVLGFSHPAYGHMAVMPAAMRLALAEDFA